MSPPTTQWSSTALRLIRTIRIPIPDITPEWALHGREPGSRSAPGPEAIGAIAIGAAAISTSTTTTISTETTTSTVETVTRSITTAAAEETVGTIILPI